ncbi:MAG: NAD(+)/NADH kinase [Chloroflexi bacterium]|nr:NAD(+)/NADH kinase [Chloroflexota bacterium]MDA1226369.1 NAD(+)/NADH kinase [Chloroflexota bacterium]
MATVGIIANPAAGKDIRRLVAHGRFVPNQEKINILKRILAGLDAVGVERVVMMPDMSALGRGALDNTHFSLSVEFLEMPVFNDELDSTRAAGMMADMEVGCLITLGGDGTNRAVAKGSRNVPLVPVSTGTNNVFPEMVEGTIAGLAAGVVACGKVSLENSTVASKLLEISVDGEIKDIALVDVAISKERFVGSRAIWNLDTVDELFLTRAEPSSIGLSAVGAQLNPTYMSDERGIRIHIGPGGTTVLAPIAPGMISTVNIARWSTMEFGETADVDLSPCTVALDGERTFGIRPGQKVQVCLTDKGPPVVSIDSALREAALNGTFQGRSLDK